MSPRKRKTLDDSLAREFVYGEADAPEPTRSPEAQSESKPPTSEPAEDIETEAIATPQPAPSPSAVTKKVDIMAQLELPPKEATIRFTVDLSQTLHRKLSVVAAQTGRKKADIVRALLANALEDV